MGEAAVLSPAKVPIEIVTGTAAHWPFVLKTWLMSYAQSEWARGIKPGIFHREHHPLAQQLLRRSTLRIVVPADDPSMYLGWCCHEGTTLHYVYAKREFRRLGIGCALVAGMAFENASHRTADLSLLYREAPTWNPYLAWRPA